MKLGVLFYFLIKLAKLQLDLARKKEDSNEIINERGETLSFIPQNYKGS